MKHRRFRHHEAGIRETTKLFGDDAGNRIIMKAALPNTN